MAYMRYDLPQRQAMMDSSFISGEAVPTINADFWYLQCRKQASTFWHSLLALNVSTNSVARRTPSTATIHALYHLILLHLSFRHAAYTR
jgi:hypothetical protein